MDRNAGEPQAVRRVGSDVGIPKEHGGWQEMAGMAFSGGRTGKGVKDGAGDGGQFRREWH